MASQHKPLPLNKRVLDTLKYFDKFDFPLTGSEVKYWSGQIPAGPERDYYFLPGRAKIVALRQKRAQFSQHKWQKAVQVGEKLKMFPTIIAIFVTGALAMNNCPADDDIDLMVVTTPHTLWLTRLVVVGYLNLVGWRRSPNLPHHTGPLVSDKICDNLWLDLDNLAISQKNLRMAHEVLQAKVLWDRAGVNNLFLQQNKWIKEYFATASKNSFIAHKRTTLEVSPWWKLLFPLNLLLFILQYLYMKPKMSQERVGLGFAFFHPRG